MTQRPPWDLEPAVGRVLITKHSFVYEILNVYPLPTKPVLRLFLKPVYQDRGLFYSHFVPQREEWVAPDLLTLRTWARLNGVELR